MPITTERFSSNDVYRHTSHKTDITSRYHIGFFFNNVLRIYNDDIRIETIIEAAIDALKFVEWS